MSFDRSKAFKKVLKVSSLFCFMTVLCIKLQVSNASEFPFFKNSTTRGRAMPPRAAWNPDRASRASNKQSGCDASKIRTFAFWRTEKLWKDHFWKIKPLNPAYEKNVELLDEFFLCFWIFEVFLFQEFLAHDADDWFFQKLVELSVFSGSIQLKFMLFFW